MAAVKFQGAGLLGLKVVKDPLTTEEILTRVDPDISNKQDVTGIRIVLRMIGIDGDPPVADLDIVVRDGGSVFKTGITVGRDLDRLVGEVSKLRKKRCRKACRQ